MTLDDSENNNSGQKAHAPSFNNSLRSAMTGILSRIYLVKLKATGMV